MTRAEMFKVTRDPSPKLAGLENSERMPTGPWYISGGRHRASPVISQRGTRQILKMIKRLGHGPTFSVQLVKRLRLLCRSIGGNSLRSATAFCSFRCGAWLWLWTFVPGGTHEF